MRLEKASLKAIKYACMNFHYAKSIPVNTFGFSVFNDKNEWCGVILYGIGANNNIAKTYNLNQGNVLELVRMALNGKQQSTSKALSLSLKILKKYNPLCKLIVSYADKDQNHNGIIYQATNWFYVGSSLVNKKDGSFIINDKRIHGKTISDKCKRYGLSKTINNIKIVYNTENITEFVTKGKIKYLYPLDKSLFALCKSLSKPYPKKSINATEVLPVAQQTTSQQEGFDSTLSLNKTS
ncbi:MAG: hypothetical protein RLZZ196_3267 [Bacteroidota bacterium]